MVTNSIVIAKDEDFEKVSAVLESMESEAELSDIALLPEYANIIFDSTAENAEEVMRVLRERHPDIAWRLMMSEDEVIKSVCVYDGKNFSVERIDKNMDEIAAEAQYSCSGNCESCSSGCSSHHEHGEGCDCEECQAEEFDLDSTIEMFDEIAREEDDTFFPTLVNAYFEEMERFCSEQADDDDVLDLFLSNNARIIIAAARADGSYSKTEHALIERIIGETDFSRMLNSLDDVIPDTDSIKKSMKYWREAEGFGYEIRRYLLMLCTYLCSADAFVNDVERVFLETIAG